MRRSAVVSMVLAGAAALALFAVVRLLMEDLYPGSMLAVVVPALIGPTMGVVIGTAVGQQYAARRMPHPYDGEEAP